MDMFADLCSKVLSLEVQPISNADRDASLKDDRRRRMEVSKERWQTQVTVSHHVRLKLRLI